MGPHPLQLEDLETALLGRFRAGCVIPAHPLALTSERKLDKQRQRALTRYYLDAGAGGLAVGVHTTQFAIREVGLYAPVLEISAREAREWGNYSPFLVAGVIGKTAQAVCEAQIARGMGYHAALLGLAAWGNASEDELISHCKTVAKEMPVIGFYLQKAVGGRDLSFRFWKKFSRIPNVIGIKMAPFDRYKTLDVVRAVAEAGTHEQITLYTGNDDHIVGDLLTPFPVEIAGQPAHLSIKGGLLGHWSVWTRKAVMLFNEISRLDRHAPISRDWWSRDASVTDSNAAFFDAANNFCGVIAGLHEVLRRQGLLKNIHCLDPDETLGPGQLTEIERVYARYPELNDDEFVAHNLERWLSD